MATGKVLGRGAVTLLSESNVATSATYTSTGKSFTLSNKALVYISMSYGSGRPVAIGVKGSETDASASVLLTAIDPTAIEDTSGLGTSGYLGAGTYYVWCKTATAGNTSLSVTAVYV